MDYSQNGEQTVLEELLSGIERGYAADIGAADGLSINNTRAFEEKGWTVLCVEPNPLYYEFLKTHRKLVLPAACDLEPRDFAEFTVIRCPTEMGTWMAGSALEVKWDILHQVRMPKIIAKQVMPVAVRTLEWCLEWAAFPRLDLLCIDTEGNDFRVLQSMDMDRWQPKVILLENWVDDPALKYYLEAAGYRRERRIDFNDLYVRVDARLPLRREPAADPVSQERREVHRAGQ